jgi:glycerol-3-phosphate dehydrogenase
MSFGKRSLLIDHDSDHGLKGLVTLIGVRATTARGMAAKAMDLVVRKIAGNYNNANTKNIPIYGGDIESFEEEVQAILRTRSQDLDPPQARHLVHNYGSQWPVVLRYAYEDQSLFKPVGKSSTLRAEIIHAIREEMAVRLSDVVFRRTDLGTGRIPTRSELAVCAALMADELGWDKQKTDSEILSIGNAFHTLKAYSN